MHTIPYVVKDKLYVVSREKEIIPSLDAALVKSDELLSLGLCPSYKNIFPFPLKNRLYRKKIQKNLVSVENVLIR